MAQHPGGVFKQEPGVPVAADDHHHPHHAQQGPPPPQHLQHPRPSSIVHQQHQQQQQQQQQQQLPPQPQHQSSYSHPHGLPSYGEPPPGPPQQHPQEIPQYYAHPSPYSTSSASGAYSSGGNPEVMAATQMNRPYPPIYHTPQSNSPASVNSPSTHDQHGRSIYGQPAAQLQQQPMYPYPPSQPQYQPIPSQGNPSPYAQHPQPQHPSMTSQPNLLMSHQPAQHQMQQQNHQPSMTSSPRTKMEHVPQMQRPPPGPLGPSQHAQNGPPMGTSTAATGGANPNAAPGPIPATTPLVVRQDGNGVQWIAFEYSRDRVKMEYTIRCDVESVNVDNLSGEFKTENCVYPRACCSKEMYRGNRLVYETECNTVGWALAELNACLRGKRGLIQRAVDSWRNSNQDSRLRSRRVRRMAKINNRKTVQNSNQHPHMAGPGGPPGMPPSTGMGPSGGPGSMGKPGLGSMGGPQLHHHHAHPDGNAQGGAEDVSGDGEYLDEQHHHHHQAPAGQQQNSSDNRPAQSFPGYAQQNYPAPPNGGASSAPSNSHDGMASTSVHNSNPLTASAQKDKEEEDKKSLFGDIPEAKKRKFILVDDTLRGSRVRVRVTLDTVDIKEIPDSYRKSNSVYPRSWFPLQMQSPPPSASGSRFFMDDDPDDSDENGRTRRSKTMVTVPMVDGEGEVATPRMRKSQRDKEVKLNELGYRMTWHQSRVFAGRIVFLQRALDCWRNKVKSTMEGTGQDVAISAPHFETRAGKRRWTERSRRAKREESP